MNLRRLWWWRSEISDMRKRAIAETSAFLTRHLDHPELAVSIPVVPAASGRKFPPSLTEAFWTPILEE